MVWHRDERALVGLVSFLFDRLDDDQAAARALLTPRAVRHYVTTDRPSLAATRFRPVRALREVAAKRMMVEMWFDGVQARCGGPSVAGLDVADAMIMALATVYADHPHFDVGWLAEVEQPDSAVDGGLDNVVQLRPERP